MENGNCQRETTGPDSEFGIVGGQRAPGGKRKQRTTCIAKQTRSLGPGLFPGRFFSPKFTTTSASFFTVQPLPLPLLFGVLVRHSSPLQTKNRASHMRKTWAQNPGFRYEIERSEGERATDSESLRIHARPRTGHLHRPTAHSDTPGNDAGIDTQLRIAKAAMSTASEKPTMSHESGIVHRASHRLPRENSRDLHSRQKTRNEAKYLWDVGGPARI